MPTPRRVLSLVIFAVAFGTNVATPLFLIYEVDLHLTTWTVTALFAIYPIGLAPALVLAGPISDAYGRRSVIFPGLVLSGVASGIMIFGDRLLVLLFIGRFLLGAVSGLVFVPASASMQELRAANGDSVSPMWNARLLSLLMYGGFGLGPFLGGIIGQWGPAPTVTPYLMHIVLVIACVAVFSVIPETVDTRGDRGPIRPNLGIPDGARREFWEILVPTSLGVFAFPALTFGLFPVLLRPAMASMAVFATGLIFISAMWCIIPAQAWVGKVGPYRSAPVGLLLGAAGTGLGLVAFATGWWPLLFPGALCMGTCSGMSMTSGLRQVEHLANPRQRGALTGSFYAGAYSGMVSPLVASTIARRTGFDAVLAAMTVFSLTIAAWLWYATKRRGTHVPASAGERPSELPAN